MHLRKFFALMLSDWLAGMSGPLTVPFTVAVFFVPSIYRILFAVLAAIAAVVTCYRLWAKEYERAETEQKKRLVCEKRLNDEEPKIIFGLCSVMDWTSLDSSGEFVFALTNCGKRPATFVSIGPIKSVSDNFTMDFQTEDILAPNSHFRPVSHTIDDGRTKKVLDKRQLWEFLHNHPIGLQMEAFDVRITFRDMQEVKQIVAKMQFDLITKKLTILPH